MLDKGKKLEAHGWKLLSAMPDGGQTWKKGRAEVHLPASGEEPYVTGPASMVAEALHLLGLAPTEFRAPVRLKVTGAGGECAVFDVRDEGGSLYVRTFGDGDSVLEYGPTTADVAVPPGYRWIPEVVVEKVLPLVEEQALLHKNWLSEPMDDDERECLQIRHAGWEALATALRRKPQSG